MRKSLCLLLIFGVFTLYMFQQRGVLANASPHIHTGDCYPVDAHAHSDACRGIIGTCNGTIDYNYATYPESYSCGTYTKYAYGYTPTYPTPSGSGWCSSCKTSYTISSSTSTWVHTLCDGCGTEVKHYHYASSCPNCGEPVTSNYNWEIDHTCYYIECSGCTDRSGSEGQTHTRTRDVRYYDCSTCHQGSYSESYYGYSCGANLYGNACGKVEGYYYDAAGNLVNPICNKIVFSLYPN